MRTLTRRESRRGFTLLELVIVLAILAAIGGIVATQFDGLADHAAEGTSTFTQAALDSAIRTYAVANGSAYPDFMDSGLTTDGNYYVGLFHELTLDGTNGPANVPQAKLQKTTLTANQLAALQAAGINNAQYINATYNVAVGQIPNADFLNPDPQNPPPVAFTPTYLDSRGVSQALVSGGAVATALKVNPVYLRQVAHYTGLQTSGDTVIAFGIGSSATIIRNGLSNAPYYAKAQPNEYGRFFALFLVTRDVAGTGSTPSTAPNATQGVVANPGIVAKIPSTAAGPTYNNFYADLPVAQFLGIIDGHGDAQDEEFAEYNGQKAQ